MEKICYVSPKEYGGDAELMRCRDDAEEIFCRLHRHDTDEQLLELLRIYSRETGKVPTKQDFIGFRYLKSRLGPWPRILEMAGLKEKKTKRA